MHENMLSTIKLRKIIAHCNYVKLKKDSFCTNQEALNLPLADEKFWLGREIGVQISAGPLEVDRTLRTRAQERGSAILRSLQRPAQS